MKINIACPSTGGQKVFDIDDEKKLRIFMELRISDEVDASPLGDEFKGYILRITGGNDKDGFPMKQGVLVNHRVRLLLKPGSVGYRRGTHDGVRRRRTVRGCIVANDLSVLNTIVVKKGEQEIPGLTDKVIPCRVGPKRASKIRKLFNLSYKDDVRQYVIARKRPNKKEGGKEHTKKPKVQRIVTSRTLQHRRAYMALRKRRWANARKQVLEYNQLIKRRARAIAAVRVEKKKSKLPPATHLHRMYMLKKAIAEKRSEKYLAKQKHLAALKWRKEHPADKKKKTTPTKEEIEKKQKRILAIRRKVWHKKALEHSRQCKNAMHRYIEDKIAAKKATKKLEQKNLKKSVRAILARKARRANAKVAKLPAILATPAPKKAKVEKKPAAKVEKKADKKKATKAQAKK
jgi:small subunit ribosomal protein S6e